MKFSIYQMAIYDIINKIRKVNPLYHFYYDRFLAEKQVGYKNEYRLSCESLLNDLIEYTDKLDSLFPAIDQKTYCMIVCGTIMQVFVSNLNEEVRIDENFIERLKSPFADEKTKEYFKHIYGALNYLRYLRDFEPTGEIIEWPYEFAFTDMNPWNADWIGEYSERYNNEIIDAIELCPSYEYAYCLLTVPYIRQDVGLYFPPIASNLRFKKAFIKGHKCMGDKLFFFLFTGEYSINESNAHYELRNSIYSNSEEVGKSRIEYGYYMIDGKPYPAGIPFFKAFEWDDYVDFLGDALEFIWYKEGRKRDEVCYDAVLLDESDIRVNYKHYPLYSGMRYFMPLYSTLPSLPKEANEYLQNTRVTYAVSYLLDAISDDMERLIELNEELERTNDDLKKQMKMNHYLVRNIAHSAVNYLNSERLAKTGVTLHNAEENDPTIEELHSDGLLLMLQSEQEKYLTRQLKAAVRKHQFEVSDQERDTKEYNLIERIRRSISKTEGIILEEVLDNALKTVIARVLFRDNDDKGMYIRKKLNKSDFEWTNSTSLFMTDVLAVNDDRAAFGWWNKNWTTIELSISSVWKKIRIKQYGDFYDLILEIVAEIMINFLAHGKLEKGMKLEFGQENDHKNRPLWAYIRSENEIGEPCTIKSGVGLSSLNNDILLLNSSKKGIEHSQTGTTYETKVWLETKLLIPQMTNN